MYTNNGSQRPLGDEEGDFLNLSLSLRLPSPPPAPSATPSSQPQTITQVPVYSQQMQSLYYPNAVIQVPSHYPLYLVPPEVFIPASPATSPTMNLNVNEPPLPGRSRARRNSSQSNGEDPNRTIQPPYEWATDRPAVVHEMSHISHDLQIETIAGMVRCNKCNREYEIRFNLEQKVRQFRRFVSSKEGNMHDRAPNEWSSPPTLTCNYCDSDGVKPIIDENKDNINWLFLFLGQMLGHCTLEQLKHFCYCRNKHRTAAKDRLLYLTYREIYRQLFPNELQVPW